MVDPSEFDKRLELFFGSTSPAVAYAYARLPGVAADSGLSLAGQLTGPTCAYAETLPARHTLFDRGPGASLVAEAVVPEPCFWTPAMPHLYDAQVELRRGTDVVGRARRTFGFRTLGAAGPKLIYDAKRWVLRGVARQTVPTAGLADWHDASAAMFVTDPSDELCEQASRIGVLLVVETGTLDPAALRRLSRWPAVGAVVLNASSGEQVLSERLAELGHNLLLAQRFGPGQPVSPAAWARLAIVEVGSVDQFAARLAGCPAAVVALRPAGTCSSLSAARSAVDQLQRDLAGQGDWAGYIV
jgi:hypothetical protein